MQRRSKLAAVLAVAVLAALAAVGVAELALRTRYDAQEARDEIARLRTTVLASIPGADEAEAKPGRIPHPYLGWDERNRFGQLRRELDLYREGRGADSFEVLIVGGSVAGLVGSQGGARIAAGLERDPRLDGRPVSVLSHGRGSFKQPQQVMLVAYLLNLGYRPDAIVNVDGFNEVALGMDNVHLGAMPLYPHLPQYAPSAGERAGSEDVEAAKRALLLAQAEFERASADALAGRALSFALTGRGARARVAALAARCGERQSELIALLADGDAGDPARGPALASRDDKAGAMDAIVAGWVEASRQLDALARNHGIAYVHVLQPTLHDAGSKPLTAREVERGTMQATWMQGVRAGYPRLRAAGPELVAAGVAYHDGSMLFRELEAETYFDACHFKGPGMDVVADAIVAWVLAELPD